MRLEVKLLFDKACRRIGPMSIYLKEGSPSAMGKRRVGCEAKIGL